MLTKREIVLLAVMLVVVSGVFYAVLFFLPARARIQALNASVAAHTAELAAAAERRDQYRLLEQAAATGEARWEAYGGALPLMLDDADVLLRIQRIVHPHANLEAAVLFNAPVLRGDALWVHGVSVRFVTDYEGLMRILYDFAQEDIYNRVVNYTVNVMRDAPDFVGMMDISLQVEFLSREGRM